MIEIHNTRYENSRSGYDYGTTVIKRDLDEAINQLLKYEFGYGGITANVDISNPEKVCLEVETRVISKLDVIKFIGPMHEMKTLLRLALIHSEMSKKGRIRDALVKNCADTAINNGLNLPIHLSLIAPMWMGGSSTHLTCTIFCSENSNTGWEEKDFEVFKSFDLDTLITFVQLIADGCTLEECLEIA